jgi:hypothetical protein
LQTSAAAASTSQPLVANEEAKESETKVEEIIFEIIHLNTPKKIKEEKKEEKTAKAKCLLKERATQPSCITHITSS